MSVQTAADDRRDSAVEHIKAAIKDLSAIVVDHCSGHDDWNADYRAALLKSYLELVELRDRL